MKVINSIATGICLSAISLSVAALGVGSPPVISFASVWLNAGSTGPARLIAYLQAEVPGGSVPQNIQSVTVTTPAGQVIPLYMDSVIDLNVNNQYVADLNSNGIVGYPQGSYTFTVTDTAGGVTTAVDTLNSSVQISGPATIGISGILPTPAGNGDVKEINLKAWPAPTVSWSAVPGAQSYRVRVRDVHGEHDRFSSYTDNATITSLTLPAGALTAGRRHVVRVEVFDDARGLPYSNARGNSQVFLVAQGPEISLAYDQSYRTGQTLRAKARIYNTGAGAVPVDIVAWQGNPDGTSKSLFRIPNVVMPSNVSGDLFNDVFHEYTFTGVEPRGIYVIGIRLLDPITGDTIAEASRSFTKN